MKIRSLIADGFRIASFIAFPGGVVLGGALIPAGVFAFGIGVIASIGLGIGIMVASYALSKGLEYCADRIEKSSRNDSKPPASSDSYQKSNDGHGPNHKKRSDQRQSVSTNRNPSEKRSPSTKLPTSNRFASFMRIFPGNTNQSESPQAKNKNEGSRKPR